MLLIIEFCGFMGIHYRITKITRNITNADFDIESILNALLAFISRSMRIYIFSSKFIKVSSFVSYSPKLQPDSVL